MILKTQLSFDYDIVVCPFCVRMAKKDLMIKWLNENSSCPICHKQITIEDCPLVYIKNR